LLIVDESGQVSPELAIPSFSLRHHTGQTLQPFGVILSATCLPLFIASGQAADELGFPVMDGIPEQKIAVTRGRHVAERITPNG